ncbi:MAG TPA: hypothetical protein VJO12_09845 [Stellaceae bacterium]|nr:hypothetical protein [Stellaceae bacterium]
MVAIAAMPTAAMAYQVFFRGLGQFIWLAGGWLTCLLGCVVIKMVPWPETMASLLALVTVLVVAIGSAGFSVGWYRALLVEEASFAAVPFSVGLRELRYFLYQATIALIVGAPVALLCLLLGWQPVWAAAFSFLKGGALNGRALLLVTGGVALLLPLSVLSFRLAARLILALAAVAIDDAPGRLLREAWRHTSGNARALFYGWLACIMPVSLLWSGLALFLNRALGVLAGPIVELAAYLCYFVALGLTAGFFSCVFSQFADGVAPDDGGGSAPEPLAA